MSIEQIHEPSIPLTAQIEYARTVASASMLPDNYRGKPADIMLAVGLGQSMGLSPAESLYRIAVIKGKPTASAELIASNVRKAGHRLRTVVAPDGQSATASIWRADDPEFEHTVTRDLSWAQAMGLDRNDNYRKQLSTMLANRAITAVARLACPEALYGVSYTPDEMVDFPAQTAPAEPTTSAARLRGALGVTVEQIQPERQSPMDDPNAFGGMVTEGAPESPLLNTSSKLARAMYAGINEAGIPESDRIEFINGTIGRDIESTKEMTEDEARRVLAALDQLKEGGQ
jgi:hypothetical protein